MKLLLVAVVLITLSNGQQNQFNRVQLQRDFRKTFVNKMTTFAAKLGGEDLRIPRTETTFRVRLLMTGTMSMKDIKLPRALQGFRPAHEEVQWVAPYPTGHLFTLRMVRYSVPFEFNGDIAYMGTRSSNKFTGRLPYVRLQFKAIYNENTKTMSLDQQIYVEVPGRDDISIVPARSFSLSNVFQSTIAGNVADKLRPLIAREYVNLWRRALQREVQQWGPDYQRLLDKNGWRAGR